MNCPKCGTPNRPGARFCGQCRAPLPGSLTMKVCPQCGKDNRMGAKFCASCGYTFATAVAPPAGPARAPQAPASRGSSPLAALAAKLQGLVRPAPHGSRRTLVIVAGAAILLVVLVMIALIAAALSAPQPSVARTVLTPAKTAPPAASPAAPAAVATSPARTPAVPTTPVPATEAGLRNALLATVQIIAPLNSRMDSTGSGSIITPRGHILTNFHVIGDPDTGKLYNSSGLIYVAVNPSDLRADPEVRYIATALEVDAGLDLALLKITSLSDGRALPAELGLSVMPVGDSDTVNIGDQLSIIGFPGLGGNTVTYTRGSVAGFLTGEGWIKTDAEINSGNSGGAAIDAGGLLVGVPSAANAEKTRVPGKIGLVRPVNLAQPLIDAANRDVR